MEKVVDVDTGEVKAATEGTTLRSVAVGSCVVVAALNQPMKTGAMAHIMLPGSAPGNATEKTKYAADAIDELIKMVTEPHSKERDIQAYLVGAGNVLKKQDDTICQVNIESVTEILKKKNIAVRASALGGTERKSVFMDIENGCISYTEGDKEEKTLWQVSQLN